MGKNKSMFIWKCDLWSVLKKKKKQKQYGKMQKTQSLESWDLASSLTLSVWFWEVLSTLGLSFLCCKLKNSDQLVSDTWVNSVSTTV